MRSLNKKNAHIKFGLRLLSPLYDTYAAPQTRRMLAKVPHRVALVEHMHVDTSCMLLRPWTSPITIRYTRPQAYYTTLSWDIYRSIL